jgi:alkylation response protein AidB-like acyl-CoA dehydrogenase
VQIYGGYGFSSDYPIERVYRDQRVNRIFEGTNEINRLLITDMLMKRSMKGELALIPAAQRLRDEILGGPVFEESAEDSLLAAEARLLAGAKKVVLLVAGSAVQRYLQALGEEQEVVAVLSNLTMDVYGMESALLRTLKKAGRTSESACGTEIAATRAFIYEAADRMESEARRALARTSEGDNLRAELSVVRRFLRRDPPDSIALKRAVADRAIALGRYPLIEPR